VREEFISFEKIRNNAIKLAYKIYRDIGIPDIIYVLLRGGALIGNIVSEYFKIITAGKRPVYYAAVVAKSYNDFMSRERVKVDGWTYSPEYLRQGDRIVLIDDIFDTGTTINHLVETIMGKGLPRSDIKIAVHDYKERVYLEKQPIVKPDYFCRKLVISHPEEDIWIHYLTHELQNLTKEELNEHYLKNDNSLSEALVFLQSVKSKQ
jgi:hypoxanthine phosphoribosyltransferase